MIGIVAAVGFVACIPVSNWMLGHVGLVCPPDGPCLVPVWPGIMAPSAVLMVGVAFVLRDLVQRTLGAQAAVVAILLGGVLSAVIAPPALAVASTAAFVLSELLDAAVYTPLYRTRPVLAVVASGVAGTVLDSLAFLFLAFGTAGLNYLPGQVIGKLWAILLAAVLMLAASLLRTSRRRA